MTITSLTAPITPNPAVPHSFNALRDSQWPSYPANFATHVLSPCLIQSKDTQSIKLSIVEIVLPSCHTRSLAESKFDSIMTRKACLGKRTEKILEVRMSFVSLVMIAPHNKLLSPNKSLPTIYFFDFFLVAGGAGAGVSSSSVSGSGSFAVTGGRFLPSRVAAATTLRSRAALFFARRASA